MKKTYMKYQSNFSKAAWIIRLITMSIAFGCVLYYLKRFHDGELVFPTQSPGYEQKTEVKKEGSVIEMQIPVGRVKD